MAGLKARLLGKENRIARRLIVLIVAFGAVITLLISAVQLVFEYRELRRGLERTLDGVGIFVPSLSASVWNFDERQIRLALDALKQLPNVDRVSVSTPDKHTRWTNGEKSSEHVVTRTYPLRQRVHGVETEIGTLEVVAKLDAIYRQAAARALSIVSGNGLLIFLVALFMVSLFRRLVTSRLERLARKMRAMGPALLPAEDAPRQPFSIPDGLDELDVVDRTLDETSKEVRRAHEEVRQLNAALEQRVIERTAQLEMANKELEAFAYSVSHDLRAPLRHIDGYVGLLVSRCRDGLSDKGLHYVETIAASARRMGELIDALLQFSRTGRAELRRESVDMNRALAEALAPLQESCATRGIEWVIGELPPARGDYALLRQVWANLLGNALKYTRTRERARIEVSGCVEEGETVFTVADNGVGFDMRYAGKLFGVFQRLHAQEEFEGTGIGLATVRRIVSHHGGRVWAESEPGRGAAFYFALPSQSEQHHA